MRIGTRRSSRTTGTCSGAREGADCSALCGSVWGAGLGCAPSQLRSRTAERACNQRLLRSNHVGSLGAPVLQRRSRWEASQSENSKEERSLAIGESRDRGQPALVRLGKQ